MAVTGPDAGTDAFASALAREGAEVIRAPLVRILPPADEAPLRAAAAGLDPYDWIVFSSVNAVTRFTEAARTGTVATDPPVPEERRLRSPGQAPVAGSAGDAAGRERRRVAAVGPATAAAAKAAGFTVAAVPELQVGSAVAGALQSIAPLAGSRVLWPRAAAARRELADALRAAGARLDEVEAYRTELDTAMAVTLAQSVARGEVDALTFTSPSAIRAYAAGGGSVVAATVVAVIGPTTAAAARAAGLPVHLEPGEHTTAALIEALRAFCEQERRTDCGT
ncbi:MAG: uroporphyrinogen-III synthase [Longimicrobiales bacterium]